MPKLDGSNVGMRAFFRISDYSKLTAELHNTREFRRGGDLLNEEPHNAHVAEQLRTITSPVASIITSFQPMLSTA